MSSFFFKFFQDFLGPSGARFLVGAVTLTALGRLGSIASTESRSLGRHGGRLVGAVTLTAFFQDVRLARLFVSFAV